MTCGSVEGADSSTVDGDESSTANEQMMAKRKEDETQSVLSYNEETLALPVANSSTDTVQRPNTTLDGSESGPDLLRERRRIRRMWKAICGGARRVGRALLPCLLTSTTEN